MTKRFQAGFSLVEVMMALGMASVVGLGAAYVVQSQVVLQKTVATKMDLNSAHAIALQKARNLKEISDVIILNSPSTVKIDSSGKQIVVEDRDTALDRCLTGRLAAGQNCSSYANETESLAPIVNESGANRIVSSINARRICNAASCSKIAVRVVTQQMTATGSTSTGIRNGTNPAGGSSSNQGQQQTNPYSQASASTKTAELATDLEFPSLAFVPTTQLDLTCANGQMITEMDVESRAAHCSPMMNAAYTACTTAGDRPMLTFGHTMETLSDSQVCSALRARTCNGSFNEAGVAVIGAGAAPIECRSLASLAATPIPTPAPTPFPAAAAPTPVPAAAAATPVPAAPAAPSVTCSCAPITISGRRWVPCGPPGVPNGTRCEIDSWLSNTLPAIGCTRVQDDPSLPDSCAIATPIVVATPTPVPAPPVAPTPAPVPSMCSMMLGSCSDGDISRVTIGTASVNSGSMSDPTAAEVATCYAMGGTCMQAEAVSGRGNGNTLMYRFFCHRGVSTATPSSINGSGTWSCTTR